MALPKWKKTKGRRNQRRMHILLKNPSLTKCSKCGRLVPPHTVCLNCGYYKGKEEIDVLKKLTKKERKTKEKEIKTKEAEDQKEKKLTLEGLSKK